MRTTTSTAPRATPAPTRQDWDRNWSGSTSPSVVTLVVLGLLSAVGSKEATSSAWVHAVIVAFFAVLLEMRMRAARRGSHRASVAVLIITAVLYVANIIEAAAPGASPTWMRFEMVAIAALMGGVVVTSIRVRAWR